jgi:uncharacterized protein
MGLDLTTLKDIWARLSGRGAYPHQLAFLLLFPGRRLQLSPRTLVRHLDLRPEMRVLEVGPGPGFFSIDVARAVPRGRLELVDLQHEMLQMARRRLRRAGVANAGCTQANAEALPFRSGTFDAAFLVAVLGEVPGPKACLRSIAAALGPGGRLLIVELAGDPDALGEEELRELAGGSGLAFAGTVAVRRGFIAIFQREPFP